MDPPAFSNPNFAHVLCTSCPFLVAHFETPEMHCEALAAYFPKIAPSLLFWTFEAGASSPEAKSWSKVKPGGRLSAPVVETQGSVVIPAVCICQEATSPLRAVCGDAENLMEMSLGSPVSLSGRGDEAVCEVNDGCESASSKRAVWERRLWEVWVIWGCASFVDLTCSTSAWTYGVPQLSSCLVA